MNEEKINHAIPSYPVSLSPLYKVDSEINKQATANEIIQLGLSESIHQIKQEIGYVLNMKDWPPGRVFNVEIIPLQINIKIHNE